MGRQQENASERRNQELEREKRILRAAIQELAFADYGGMSIEAVAQRAGVNKTTVYRKWATKADLIRAALDSVFEVFQFGPSTGSLRSDLIRIGNRIRMFLQTVEAKSLLRLRLLQHPVPELASIAKELTTRQDEEFEELIEAALARGEITRETNMPLLADMLWGTLFTRLELSNEPVSDELLETIVDILMDAAQRPARRKPQPAPRATQRPRRAKPAATSGNARKASRR